ncbi:MAG: threonine synthase [Gammaproteobacteria bacterium]|jgi:threonine synthase|nr:threonine synthase [Gammaproteobacteria bacterium]
MKYCSTRNSKLNKTFDEIIIEGLAPDGGLYMPKSWPKININEITSDKNISYNELVTIILDQFVGDTIKNTELQQIAKKTYREFTHNKIAPLVKLKDNKYILELFHGPTYAFKDYPLQMLGNLFQYYLKKEDKKITVIGATSGDTGSAAIDACKNKDNINIFILHPKNKTSDIQRKQMTTIQSKNVFNIAINGTFDDCQNIVKSLFVSDDLKKITTLSAINSINWARIASQSVYFFWAYLQSLQYDKNVNFIVPTGNFGNVYAAHISGIMGLPINKLYVATNSNDIMHRTIANGDMSLKDVKSTISPSMDIQISSNFERQLFESLNYNSSDLSKLMKSFKDNNQYDLSGEIHDNLKLYYRSKGINDSLTSSTIKKYYEEYNYISDPHTATSLNILDELDNNDINIALACAHPAKFPESINDSIGIYPEQPLKLKEMLDSEEKYINLSNDIESVKSYIIDNI